MRSTPAHKHGRLEGLDLVRWLALIGMVIVNFNIFMVAKIHDPSLWQRLAEALQGRAAAVFVVLAGVGLGLASARSNWTTTGQTIVKRAAFLFLLGMLNQLFFPADIIHYYAIYFLLGMFFLRSSNAMIWGAILILIAGFTAMVIGLDYDAEWNWNTYAYTGFWTLGGFFKNLFFNGWHPVFPWLSFLLFGVWLSRLSLARRTMQAKLLAGGALVYGLTAFASSHLIIWSASLDPEAAILFTTTPVPPMPLYVLAGTSAASFMIGGGLLLAPALKKAGVLDLISPAGRMTLTLYLAHIILGMGALWAFDMYTNRSPASAVFAALVFCFLATIIAYLWNRKFHRGPVESVMRWL